MLRAGHYLHYFGVRGYTRRAGLEVFRGDSYSTCVSNFRSQAERLSGNSFHLGSSAALVFPALAIAACEPWFVFQRDWSSEHPLLPAL